MSVFFCPPRLTILHTYQLCFVLLRDLCTTFFNFHILKMKLREFTKAEKSCVKMQV